VPDPDRIAVDRKSGKLITGDIPYILNPVDLSAIELALRCKEQTGATVTAVSIDEPAAEHEVREALAMGCDRALLLADEAFESTDTLAQAHVFGAALERFVKPQIVFAASRSIDHNWSSVGPQLAQILNWALVIEAETVEMAPSFWRGIAHTGAYRARMEAELPAIVTVARAAVKPRPPTSWGIAAAYDEKKVDVKTLHDMGVDPTTLALFAPKTKVLRVEERKRKRERRVIEGEPPEVGRILARRLIDQGWAGRRP
jgi:electron transfer flavoprotein beta subunit